MIHALCALLSLHEVDRRLVVGTIGRFRMRPLETRKKPGNLSIPGNVFYELG
jgi:hypothetical protein